MDILPNAESAVISINKLVEYALNPARQRDKALAFKLALGYDIGNCQQLIDNVRANIRNFPAIPKPDLGYGKRYQVVMDLLGENGRRAKVLTAWIVDKNTNETRLISIYVDE